MRVICIDSSPSYSSGKKTPLVEGDIYEVKQSLVKEEGVDVVSPTILIGVHKKRFIPLSEIDETEMELINSIELKF